MVSLIILIASVLAAGVWWQLRSPARSSADQHHFEGQRSIGSSPEAPALGESTVRHESLAPVDANAGRIAGTAAATEVGDAEAPGVFDAERPLLGRVLPRTPPPADERIEVVVEVWTKPNSMDSGVGSDRMPPDGYPYREVARVTPLADGTFETPRPKGVTRVKLSVNGDYTVGSFEYEVEGEDDPGDVRFDIRASVLAHVTLQLAFDGVATPAEIAELEGETVEFRSSGSSEDNQFFHGTYYKASGDVTRGGRVVLGPIAGFYWQEGGGDDTSIHQRLAPFLIESGFSFKAKVGERNEIDVPVRRGLPFDGAVIDENGAPIAGAAVSLLGHWGSAGERGDYEAQRTTDAAGRFAFHAFPDELDQIKVEATGYIGRELGPSECAALLTEGRTHTFSLDAGAQLHVRVTGEGGLPVKGLTLTARSANASSTAAVWQSLTDDNGHAHFVALPAGPLELGGVGRLQFELQNEPGVRQVMISPHSSSFGAVTGCDPAEESLWTLTASVSAEQAASGEQLDLAVRPAPTVRGRITGQDPAWPDPVRLVIRQQNPYKPMRSRMRANERSPGTFAIDSSTGAFSGQIAPGKYAAVAISGSHFDGGFTLSSAAVHETPEVEFEVGNEDVDIAVAFAQVSEIEGRVRLAEGTPVTNIAVHLSHFNGSFDMPMSATESDSTGRFHFDVRAPGEYNLRLNSPRYSLVSSGLVEVAEGMTYSPVELVATLAGAVHVTTLRSDGTPRTEAGAAIQRHDGRPIYAELIDGTSEWAGAMGPLPPGTYVAVVSQSTEDGTLLHRRPFQIVSGEVTNVSVQEVPKATVLASGVATSGGRPAADLQVWLADETGTRGSGKTDNEGRFRLALLDDGPMKLCWGPSVWTPIGERGVVMSAGTRVMEPIVLPSGAVEGQVGDGLPFRTTPVIFRAQDPPDAPPYRWVSNISNRHFRINYLPDGAYRMTTAGHANEGDLKALVLTFEIENGGTVRGLELESPKD